MYGLSGHLQRNGEDAKFQVGTNGQRLLLERSAEALIHPAGLRFGSEGKGPISYLELDQLEALADYK